MSAKKATKSTQNKTAHGGRLRCPCSPSSTPEMDAAAYEATTRTVGKWIVPLAKAREMERQRNEARTALRDVMAFGGDPDAEWELDPTAKGLFERCRAIVGQSSENAESIHPETKP